VGRRLREHGLRARTVQLKLRYSDFSTITRAQTLAHGTDLDPEIFDEIRRLFRANWKPGAKVRLLGVHAASWEEAGGQMSLEGEGRREKWQLALAAADKLRDRFGESAVSLAGGLGAGFRERVQENPADLPGRKR
jgi:DNA polymerase-4